MIIDNLIDRIKELNSPICLGLDTTLALIPHEILNYEIGLRWRTPSAVKMAMIKFNREVIDAIEDIIPCIKIDISYYQKYGQDGIEAYIDAIIYAKSKGIFVIADVNAHMDHYQYTNYSEAYFDGINIAELRQPTYDTEFMTADPYTMRQDVQYEFEENGIFLNIKNSSSSILQHIMVDDSMNPGSVVPLYMEAYNQIARETVISYENKYNFRNLGVILSPAHQSEIKDMRNRSEQIFLIMDIKDIKDSNEVYMSIPGFRTTDKIGTMVTHSKMILGAHNNEIYIGMKWQNAIRSAILSLRDTINQALEE